MATADLVGLLLGNLLDVNATDGAEDDHRLLGGAVPDNTGVVLLLNFGLRVNEHAARHLAADLDLQHVDGVRGGFVWRVGELHAAGLHPAAAEHLALDDARPVDLLGRGLSLLRSCCETKLGDRDSGAANDLASLVFVKAHWRRRTLAATLRPCQPGKQKAARCSP